MGRMFYPKSSVLVDASAPHPENTQYRISIGEEDWEGTFQTVVKVQMVYGGKVAGRKSPSYPIGSDDSQRVEKAMEQLVEDYKKGQEVVRMPAKPVQVVPVSHFLAVISQVPEGKITRWEDIECFFMKAYGTDSIKPNDAHWPQTNSEGFEIPYWRIVGTYGYLSDDMRCSKTKQYERLMAEGHAIEPCGAGQKSLRVVDYKKSLVDLKSLQLDLTDVPNTDKSIYDTMLDCILDSEKIKGIPTSSLENLIQNSSLHSKPIMLKAIECAARELDRRINNNLR